MTPTHPGHTGSIISARLKLLLKTVNDSFPEIEAYSRASENRWNSQFEAPIKSMSPSFLTSVRASTNSETGTSGLSLCKQKISNCVVCSLSSDSIICGLINLGSQWGVWAAFPITMTSPWTPLELIHLPRNLSPIPLLYMKAESKILPPAPKKWSNIVNACSSEVWLSQPKVNLEPDLLSPGIIIFSSKLDWWT